MRIFIYFLVFKMKKILNKILRNDLDLNKYWWHRLFKVAFLIVLIATIIITAHITWEKNNRYRKPYLNKDYYEITSTLSNYISKHSGKSLASLENILEDDTYVVDKEHSEYEEYKIWDIIKYDYFYYGYGTKSWLISDGYSSIESYQDIECKDGMTIDDVKEYKNSKRHYNSRYYSQETNNCESFPDNDLLLNQAIKKNLQTPSNCIVSNNNCMYIVWKQSNFMNQYLVAEKTEKATKHANELYHKEMREYYKEWSKTLLKTILVTLWITSGIAILLMLLYYKWFIYIVYWGKKE